MPVIRMSGAGGISGPGAGGGFAWEKQLSNYAFTNTGDVTAELETILSGLTPGQKLTFNPWETYQISDTINFGDLDDVEIDFANACLQVNGVWNDAILNCESAKNLTLSNLRIIGARELTTNGSSLTNVAANMVRVSPNSTGFQHVPIADWTPEVNASTVQEYGGGALISTPNPARVGPLADGDWSIVIDAAKRYPAVAGAAYTAQMQINQYNFSGTLQERMTRLDMIFYDSGGSVLATTAGTAVLSPIIGSYWWLPITVTATAPANTVRVGIRVAQVAAVAGSSPLILERFILKRTVAPTNAVVSTTKVLASCGDAVQLLGNSTVGRQQFWARQPNGMNKWGFTISGSATQTGAAIIRVIDLRNDKQMHAVILDVTTTPTINYLEWTPTDIEAPYRITLQNASTVTPITITVTSSYEWGRSTYSSAGDNHSGIRVGNTASNIKVRDLHVEGVYGDAFEVTGAYANTILFENVLSRANGRQGFSVNRGEQVTVDKVQIIGCGRSAIDIEPFASSWRVKKLVVTNVRAAYCVNSVIAMTNWHLINDVTMDNITGIDCGGGLMVGGCDGGSFNNIRHLVTSLSGTELDTQIYGRNMVGEIHSGRGVSIGAGAAQTKADASGVVTTVYPQTNPGLKVYTTAPGYHGRMTAYADNQGNAAALAGGFVDVGDDLTVAPDSNIYSGIIRADDPDTSIFGFHPGSVQRWFPNTYKGLMVRNLHFIHGADFKSEPLMAVRGVSATTTRSNNLRGIAVAVTEAATTLAVTFPGHGVAATSGIGNRSGLDVSGTLIAGTYYYRFAEIVAKGRGPGPARAAVSVTLTGGQDAALLNVVGLVRAAYNTGNGYLPYGFTIYRGTSSTVMDIQYDVLPTVDFPSLNNASQNVTDYGDHVALEQSVLTDRWWGWPAGNIAGVAHSGVPVDQSGWEPDTSYAIQVTPSWSTTCWVTAKAKSGFTISFGTAAPASATVDWFLVR